MRGNGIKLIKGGITAVPGFLASGVYAGIKKMKKGASVGSGPKDLALIYSEKGASVAGLFTNNRFKAAPLLIDMKHLRSRKGQAIVINSGNANACTGDRGYKDALKMAEITSKGLGIKSSLVYVASTGVIGQTLPMEKIRKGISEAIRSLNKKGGRDAAEAIMTTDTFIKEIAVKGNVNGYPFVIGGIAKGAGMIHPQLATMLCFITTDVNIPSSLLQRALNESVGRTFNLITVDRETSTNDMILCLANGLAGNKRLMPGDSGLLEFQRALEYVCLSLSEMIVKDGEGATKFVEVRVKGARSHKEAKDVAYSIANSVLVKTALFGEDPNWGRLMAAIGNSGASVKGERIDIYFDDVKMTSGGIGLGKKAEKGVSKVLKKKRFAIIIDLHRGDREVRVLTTDLSYDYVRINAAYRT